jgi:beta-lactamase superfamily II metal-dependent hydrolase
VLTTSVKETMRNSMRGLKSLVLGLLLSTVACGGGGGGTGPEPDPPQITVSGVADGEVYDQPVTIVVTVDVGTYSATLNDQNFFSGTTVSAPGSYTLDVLARNGTASSTAELSFSIELGGPGVMILRTFDLGENENGGGGDALLLTDSTAAGLRHVLFDAGPEGLEGANRAYVSERLQGLGVDTLEALVLSHAHSDHFDGMSDVLDRVHVRTFYYNGQVRNFSRYTSLIFQAATDADERITVTEPVEMDVGTAGATGLRILPPLPDYLSNADPTSSEINNGSIGVRVTRGTFSLFVTGDGEVEANQRWRTVYADDTRSITALKVGHHGANDAVFDNGSFGSSAWLDHTDPELQLISANGNSHPRIRALSTLLGQTAQTYCTPVHGDIEVRVDASGENWFVSVERNADMDCVPGSDATT